MTARGVFLMLTAVLAGTASASAPPARGAEPVEAPLAVLAEMPARLVLGYWPPAGWRVRQSGRLVELALPDARLAIRVDAVPLPAAGGAVVALGSEVTAEATLLRIGLGCDCALAVHGDGARLVMDVVNAGGHLGPLDRDAGPAPLLARMPPPRGGAGASEASAGRDFSVAQAVEETRSRLLDQLRRAAEAGIVKLRPGPDGLLAGLRREPSIADRPLAGEVGEGSPESGFGDDQPGATVLRAAGPVTPIRASYASPPEMADAVETPEVSLLVVARTPDPTPQESGEALIAPAQANDCIPSEKFVLPDPMAPQAFVEEVARLRRSLVGEFDLPDPVVALDLARLHLGHGLGLEAHRVLDEFAPAEPQAPLLAAISRLAEGRPLPVPSLLDVPGCEGQHALWQALDAALRGEAGEAVALLEAARGALEQVTHGLRGRVAVRLGLAAAEHGDWIAAHRLEAMANRALPANDRYGREMKALLSALVLRERGDSARAAEALARLGAARSPAGVEALILRAEQPAEGAADSAVALERLRLDLGALVTAYRDSPLGARAFRAEVLTTGRLMGRNAAFELVDYGLEAGLIDESGHRELLAEIGAGLEALSGDTPLAILYENGPGRFSGLQSNESFRAALARSYIALGAPALAERVLRPGDLADRALRDSLAAAHAELGNETAALRLAERPSAGAAPGPSGAGASGHVRSSGGSLEAAATEAGAPERARVAWAAGDWLDSVEALKSAAAQERTGELAGREVVGEEATGATSPKGPVLALRLALAAKRAGLQTLPPEAAALAGPDPALEAGLRAIFHNASGSWAPPTPEALARTLEEVAHEARMYRETLEDG